MLHIVPACFPLLSVRGTQGFRFGLKKNERLPLGDPVERIEDRLKDGDNDKEYIDAVEEVVASASVAIREAIEQGKIDLGDDTVVVPNAERSVQYPYKANEPKRKQKGKKEENISMRQFWRYRTYKRDEIRDDGTKIPHTFHWLWTMQKLSEYFIINVLNR